MRLTGDFLADSNVEFDDRNISGKNWLMQRSATSEAEAANANKNIV